MHFLDITYQHIDLPPEKLPGLHQPNLGYLHHLPAFWKKSVIKFAPGEGKLAFPDYDYYFFPGKSGFTWTHARANQMIRSLQPDVILFHGLIFPWQLFRLKKALPGHVKFIIQHHAEQPGKGIKKWMQRLACRYADAVLFSTRELSEPWVSEGIIPDGKVFEVMEGSSVMHPGDQHEARRYLGLGDETVFLWVGRLDSNKDPVTVLKAFQRYAEHHPEARLYMIFQGGPLENTVLSLVRDTSLRSSVTLTGEVQRDRLNYWYNAADYFVSASKSEGSGYALIEAMSCGCIPIVTDIPSFRKITAAGKAGYLFPVGDAGKLYELMMRLDDEPHDTMIAEVLQQFESELSFRAIADRLVVVCDRITSAK